MADNKEAFATLEDGSGNGVALREVQAGDSSAAKNGLIGFSFKDASGNVILPSLDSNGAVPVSFMDKTKKYAKGELAAGSLTSVLVTGAVLTLTVGKKYTNLCLSVSCRSDSLFQLVHIDDSAGTPVSTVKAECIVGAGQYSFNMKLDDFLLDTTGGTGVVLLEVQAKNFEKLNDLRCAFSVQEY